MKIMKQARICAYADSHDIVTDVAAVFNCAPRQRQHIFTLRTGFLLCVVLLLITVCGIVSAQDIKFFASAKAKDGILRLQDIADVSFLPVMWRASAAELVLARMNMKQEEFSVTTAQLAREARRQLPGISAWVTGSVHETVRIQVVKSTASSKEISPNVKVSKCLKLVQPVAKGAAFSCHDLQVVSCPQNVAQIHSAYFDRDTHLARARSDMQQGYVLLPISPQTLAEARRKDKVAIVVQSGGLIVTRSASVLSDTARGNQIILSGSDGLPFVISNIKK